MLLQLLADTLGGILGAVFGEKVSAASSRADRRRLSEGMVRCTIRSVEGRVLGIGTEWSLGDGALSPGRILFTPQMGIVGERDIEVLGIRETRIPARETPTVHGPTSSYIVTTSAGELYWVIPSGVADAVRELVLVPEPQ